MTYINIDYIQAAFHHFEKKYMLQTHLFVHGTMSRIYLAHIIICDVGKDIGCGGAIAEWVVEVIEESDGEFGALWNHCHGSILFEFIITMNN